MHCRAVTNRDAPNTFVEALDFLKPRLIALVTQYFPDKSEKSLKGAGLVVEETGLTDDEENVVQYTVNGVTALGSRKNDELAAAISELIDELAEEHWPDAHVSIFVVLQLFPKEFLAEHESEVAVVSQ